MNFSKLHIHTVEVGVETYNDHILKKYKKPANKEYINKALWNVTSQGIKFVPNIILGMPEEGEGTYTNTILWLSKNMHLISNINIYNLAVYADSKIGIVSDDSDETNIDKDWLTESENTMVKHVSRMIHTLAVACLKRPSTVKSLNL